MTSSDRSDMGGISAVPPGEVPTGPLGNGAPHISTPHVIVLDLEICDPVEHCTDGWEGARRGDCGVSVVVLYDNQTERFHVYDERALEAAVDHINTADILTGHNIIEFDIPCLQGVTGLDLHPDSYDTLREIWRVLPTRQKGYKLNQICERLGLGRKNSQGAMATELYRDGNWGKLVDYCINDVSLSRKLARWIERYGYILDPEGAYLSLPRPGVTL